MDAVEHAAQTAEWARWAWTLIIPIVLAAWGHVLTSIAAVRRDTSVAIEAIRASTQVAVEKMQGSLELQREALRSDTMAVRDALRDDSMELQRALADLRVHVADHYIPRTEVSSELQGIRAEIQAMRAVVTDALKQVSRGQAPEAR